MQRKYKNVAERQKAYRERKLKESKQKTVTVFVPLTIYEEIQGNSNKLIEGYFLGKHNIISADEAALIKERLEAALKLIKDINLAGGFGKIPKYHLANLMTAYTKVEKACEIISGGLDSLKTSRKIL